MIPNSRPGCSASARWRRDPDQVDLLLAEIEAQQPDGTIRDPNQLDLFGTLVAELHTMQRRPGQGDHHQVATLSGRTFRGTWEEILMQMKEADQEWSGASLAEFMLSQAARGKAETGIVIPVTDIEAFIRASAQAGVLRIIQ